MEKLKQIWASIIVLAVVVIGARAVPITYLESAVAKGAVCLDGSPPAYHFERGSGTGVNNWVVLMEGGGWCRNIYECEERTKSMQGSSKVMNKDFGFSGILGNMQNTNPDFYNWNRVKIRYCDGSSFTGDVEAVDPKTKIHYRGGRIWRAMMDDLLAKGMKDAKNAILTGCSAGALASILHCDDFKSILPATATVKCVSDAGYFINGKDLTGGSYIESYYKEVVTTHGSVKNLPAACTKTMKPELCFFPENVVKTMKTPLFVLNAAFDYWQIKNVLAPSAADKTKQWEQCKFDLAKCSPAQLQTVQAYRDQMLAALKPVQGSKTSGLYLTTCYAHCQSSDATSWFGSAGPVVANTSMAKAVGDWFFDRKTFQDVDCPTLNCNPTCPPPPAATTANPSS